MAARTRIDLKFLEAIDNGNFSFLLDLYVKAFIKQYAKAVDLDEQETIKI
jgi:cytoskeletal protein RodZ